MRTSLFSLLAVLTPIALHGQRTVPEVRAVEQVATSSATVTDTPATEVGSVHIDADPRIEKLMTSYSEHKHVQRGYRVQIFLGDRKRPKRPNAPSSRRTLTFRPISVGLHRIFDCGWATCTRACRPNACCAI